jgi:hypothetical protein
MKQASPTPILKASSQKPDLPVGKQVRDAVQKGIGGQQAMKSPQGAKPLAVGSPGSIAGMRGCSLRNLKKGSQQSFNPL